MAALNAEHDKVVNTLRKKCRNAVQIQQEVSITITITFHITTIAITTTHVQMKVALLEIKYDCAIALPCVVRLASRFLAL